MFIGPVFSREVATTPRREKLYIYRAVYVSILFVVMCTAWLVVAGTQVIRNIGDMARFGTLLFQILAPLQLALLLFLSALHSASEVAQEKDRRTLILLLMTQLNSSELVLGKLLASLLSVLVMLIAGLPLFVLAVLFGGISFSQVFWVFAVSLSSALTAGSLGSTLALWREKTFQTLALTTLALVVWLGIGEPIYAGLFGWELIGISCEAWGTALSPLRAVLSASRPALEDDPALGILKTPVNFFLLLSILFTLGLNLLSILMVRVWNPSNEVRRKEHTEENEQQSIWGVEHDFAKNTSSDFDLKSNDTEANRIDSARAKHVDAQEKSKQEIMTSSRAVWDNPILWREICTWAYGKKVIAIRVSYVFLFAIVAVGLHWTLTSAESGYSINPVEGIIPASSKLIAPLLIVSLVIVNALAVTSITNERDGQALDLLLVTDLAPKEFVFGKLGGIIWVTKEMILLPLVLCVYLWWNRGITLENLFYTLAGMIVMNIFVAMLGIHCGMRYANSRTAISVSLGTVFFLFLGIVTCIVLMISFSGSFQVQLAPFLALVLGGGVGLYVSLGARNPSAAIGAASLLVPFATFYAITSFMLEYTLAVFLVTSLTYGFTTAAMMIPAVYEFDVAMGRTTTEDE